MPHSPRGGQPLRAATTARSRFRLHHWHGLGQGLGRPLHPRASPDGVGRTPPAGREGRHSAARTSDDARAQPTPVSGRQAGSWARSDSAVEPGHKLELLRAQWAEAQLHTWIQEQAQPTGRLAARRPPDAGTSSRRSRILQPRPQAPTGLPSRHGRDWAPPPCICSQTSPTSCIRKPASPPWAPKAAISVSQAGAAVTGACVQHGQLRALP